MSLTVRWGHRMIAVLGLAILALLMTFVAPLVASATAATLSAPVQQATYTYGSLANSLRGAGASPERGPPAADSAYTYTTHDAAHRWSGDVSALPSRRVAGPMTTSPTPAEFAQGEVNTATTGSHVLFADAGSRAPSRVRVAANSGKALTRYDADFAIGQLTSGGRGTASGLVDIAESQGWKAVQSSSGPLKYLDSSGVERLVIKRGSARTPGSDVPHVAIRNAAGQRVDPYGNLVTRSSPGNHTPITYDLP